MSLTIVNGYPCRDCADIAKAKRGEDPNAKETAGKNPAGKPPESPPDPAVVLGGSLAPGAFAGADQNGNLLPSPPRKGAWVDLSA